MILASILITSEDDRNRELPSKLRENVELFKKVHPGIEHRLFNGFSARDFIAENFDKGVLSAYDALKPFAYKCDLARYCVMYHFGGVYADVSIYFLKSWAPHSFKNDTLRLAVFRDFLWSAPWETVNGIYSAPPHHEALFKAIELICANVRNRYYGSTNLCPTGPALFGKAIALTCDPGELIVGESAWFTPGWRRSNLVAERSHSFMFKGEMVAIRRKRSGGSMTELGVIGGNDYCQLWRAKDIYASGL